MDYRYLFDAYDVSVWYLNILAFSRLQLYELIENKIQGDGNCQVVII